ncbi:MAG: hypothetical protein CMJ23_04825 [Phycisphaerae bacterium]|nr:hypothetical protein [Phycisphaerae bacterium]
MLVTIDHAERTPGVRGHRAPNVCFHLAHDIENSDLSGSRFDSARATGTGRPISESTAQTAGMCERST